MMRKVCRCGQIMKLGIRPVIYENRIEVDRVPINECDECNYYEVVSDVKADLLDLLNQLKQQGESGRVLFTEVNELADVLYSLYLRMDPKEVASFEKHLEQSCEERINLLLDLYGCANKLNDSLWRNEIAARLSTLSNFVRKRHCIETK